MTSRRRNRTRAVLFILAGVLAACRTANPVPNTTQKRDARKLGGQLITAEAIAQTSARNAWEVLQQNMRFSMGEQPNGEPARIESRQGRSSILLSSSATPLIYLDGAQILDIRMLRQISAESIETIRIMNGIEGTTFYGTNAGAGVIVIKTKAGPARL